MVSDALRWALVAAEGAGRLTGPDVVTAVAASAALIGSTLAAAPVRLRARIAALGGLVDTEKHALAMLLRALQQVSRR